MVSLQEIWYRTTLLSWHFLLKCFFNELFTKKKKKKLEDNPTHKEFSTTGEEWDFPYVVPETILYIFQQIPVSMQIFFKKFFIALAKKSSDVK